MSVPENPNVVLLSEYKNEYVLPFTPKNRKAKNKRTNVVYFFSFFWTALSEKNEIWIERKGKKIIFHIFCEGENRIFATVIGDNFEINKKDFTVLNERLVKNSILQELRNTENSHLKRYREALRRFGEMFFQKQISWVTYVYPN